VSIHIVWRSWGALRPTVRLHISSRLTPEETDLAARFAQMVQRLPDLVWEERLYPIHAELLEKLGPVRLAAMSRTATPYVRPPEQPGTIGVTIDVGERPATRRRKPAAKKSPAKRSTGSRARR
jgi:hypothetical protein